MLSKCDILDNFDNENVFASRKLLWRMKIFESVFEFPFGITSFKLNRISMI
jgi:hypothetical protein